MPGRLGPIRPRCPFQGLPNSSETLLTVSDAIASFLGGLDGMALSESVRVPATGSLLEWVASALLLRDSVHG